MRLIIQSVYSASVEFQTKSSSLRRACPVQATGEGDHEVVVGFIKREIGRGILIYLGIHIDDLETYPDKIEKITKKLPTIRFLEGENSIDQSINSINGEILLIPNFTVYGRNHKGTSMEFTNSAPFTKAKEIYEYFIKKAQDSGRKIKTGEFGADMKVLSENRGPLNYVFDY